MTRLVRLADGEQLGDSVKFRRRDLERLGLIVTAETSFWYASACWVNDVLTGENITAMPPRFEVAPFSYRRGQKAIGVFYPFFASRSSGV